MIQLRTTGKNGLQETRQIHFLLKKNDSTKK